MTFYCYSIFILRTCEGLFHHFKTFCEVCVFKAEKQPTYQQHFYFFLVTDMLITAVSSRINQLNIFLVEEFNQSAINPLIISDVLSCEWYKISDGTWCGRWDWADDDLPAAGCNTSGPPPLFLFEGVTMQSGPGFHLRTPD